MSLALDSHHVDNVIYQRGESITHDFLESLGFICCFDDSNEAELLRSRDHDFRFPQALVAKEILYGWSKGVFPVRNRDVVERDGIGFMLIGFDINGRAGPSSCRLGNGVLEDD